MLITKNNKTSKYGYFQLSEFKISGNATQMNVDERIMTVLNVVRFKYGKPVRINSCGRTEEYNRSVGGASDSYHLITSKRPVMAIDSSPVNGDYQTYRKVILDNIGLLKAFGVKHVGVYDAQKFIHLDVGGTTFSCWGVNQQEKNFLVSAKKEVPLIAEFTGMLFADAHKLGINEIFNLKFK